MNKKVVGKSGITAQVVAHSVSKDGKELITMSIKYGLIVHGEFLRHRLLSNSVKSNRAIPMDVLRKEVLEAPYVPVFLGAKQRGMVADNEVKNPKLAEKLWKWARYPACFAHWIAEKLGAHKEWANRLLNPWQYVEETVTATEWDNFYHLRLDSNAQRDIQELAKVMLEAYKQSIPTLLQEGEWHTPYVASYPTVDNKRKYIDNDGKELCPVDAVKVSAARCARSSYNKHDKTTTTLKDDLPLYSALIEASPVHGSPLEHQGTPMVGENEDNYTHISKDGVKWSGNFQGWVQARQTLEGHTNWNYLDQYK